MIFPIRVLAIEFNTDLLDLNDKNNIDFSRFSQAGYIMPGQYDLNIKLNNKIVFGSGSSIDFFINENDAISKACITRDIVRKLGLKADVLKKLQYSNNNQCADLGELPGVEFNPDMAEGVLNISIPQVWLEYSDSSWLPPSRWENGLSGVMFDYNLNGNLSEINNGGSAEQLGYNGILGANINVWRLRADYRGSYNHSSFSGEKGSTQNDFEWSRIYAYRALPDWQSNLTVGEEYIKSDIFDSWNFTGLNLSSDDRMIPPKMRGYAPQVSGIAETNARVVITQKNRILYDSTVPAGAFTINDLNGSIRGRLDVEVIEQNGKVKKFHVDAAYVPYLTRPDRVRYKLSLGRPRVDNHNLEGPAFITGEASWGVNNHWSLYGGAVIAGDYNALNIGVAKDLQQFGSLSADITQSFANLPHHDESNGKSWRVSYSKRFDDANTDITFAGYRFSEKDYMTMQQYLDSRYNDSVNQREKELYSLSMNKVFEDLNLAFNLQYSHQTYWDNQSSRYYNLSLNQYFDVFSLKGVSLGLSASRTDYHNKYLDSIFLSLSLPLGKGTVSFNSSISDDVYEQSLGYSGSMEQGLSSYNINAGIKHGHNMESNEKFSGYYSHQLPSASLSTNLSWEERGYTSLGMTLSGGATLTKKGVALHSGNSNGGTRLMIDTDGIEGVPIDGGRAVTNDAGIAVLTSVNSYYRNTTSIDLNRLPENVEVRQAVTESVLTEGAIGYRFFETLKGERLFVTLINEDGSFVPFGSSVRNIKGKELGIVGEEGLAWLSGLEPGSTIEIQLERNNNCAVDIPVILKPELQTFICNN